MNQEHETTVFLCFFFFFMGGGEGAGNKARVNVLIIHTTSATDILAVLTVVPKYTPTVHLILAHYKPDQ